MDNKENNEKKETFARNIKFKPRICKLCSNEFIPSQWNQLYCGSKTKKTGCSYKEHLHRINVYIKENYKEYMREYASNWRKVQRILNTPYMQRQNEAKKLKSRTPEGRLIANTWRKNNLKKILIWNRKRIMLKRGVIGSHTLIEWEEVKKKFNYKCAICGINELELSSKWKRKGFDKLTRDHIVPLSRGGTDYINNIQPLCIGCNARKHAEEVIYG